MVELRMNLPRPVHAVVFNENPLDLFHQFRISQGSFRRRAFLRRPVCPRSDLHTCLFQDCTDRLDPEFLPLYNTLAVIIDIVDDYRERNLPPTGRILRGYLVLRSSSAAAKNAEAVFRISFARCNSRTSRGSW